MPRPGPRPYDCVRRAWHSDRHHPIRGSLIQELFRIVNEVHSSATRKNREWQEKTPIVVLKAEEIMYSKAKSEAEYVDLSTLWDRANDAINIIIRRDETSETGVLLQPCIEAALHLGCTPRRASRSERNISPGCYLNPNKLQSSELLAPQLMNPSKNLESLVSCSCSVYPLYYGSQSHVGHPTSIPLARMAEKEDLMEKDESGCDLTLHLGGALAARDDDESLRQREKDELALFSPEWIQEGQNSNAELNFRKRKAGVSHPLEHGHPFYPL